MKNFTLKMFTMICFLFFAGSTLTAQDVVDLTGIDSPTVLGDTLPGVADGSVILLEPGKTYNTGGYYFDKSLEIKSSDPLAAEMPHIDCEENFNLLEGATVGSVVFTNISFSGLYDENYIFNISKSGTIGEIKFESCKIHSLRGVARVKDGEGSLDKYTIENCVIDSIRDYAILTMDKSSWICNDIMIKNSTISKAQMFLTSRNNSNSITIDGCTLNEVPEQGRQMFRWREEGQNNVLNGINILNTVWSHGWNQEGEASYSVDGFDGLGETTWNIGNTYTTSEFSFKEGKDTILEFPNFVYEGTADDLWVDRGAMDFNFLDAAFGGASTAGDPMWRVEEVSKNASVWNFSTDDFNALGELAEPVTVNGLTIYASSDKTVKIDGNNKSIDGMDFTTRLKLGGSGKFEDGAPVGRVLAFDVSGNTNITVMGMSSSSSSDRVLNIESADGSLVGEFAAMGESISKGVFAYFGGPTTIYLYSPSSGVNLYYVKATPVAESREWNMGSEAFNALGELAETVSVEGLTIYANSEKKVKIDSNNKSVDGMDFTHRLKLGGSGQFDENGLPTGRVLTFEVSGNTKITVAGMSSSSSSDRVLMIAAGDKDTELAQFPALGESISKADYDYTGGPTTIYLYSPSSGVNVYYIKAERITTSVTTRKAPAVKIYPNPATDRVFVSVNEPTEIGVFNIAGQMLVQKEVRSSRDYIDINELPTGLYFVKSLNNSSVAQKLIKR